MHASRTPAVGRQDLHKATQHFGHAAGRSLALQEQHLSAIAAAERARLLKEAGGSVSATPIYVRVRRSVGAAFVRIGQRLQAPAGQPAEATPR